MASMIPGLTIETATAHALKQFEINSGQSVTELMRALPPVKVDELATLKPTAIGKEMGISARDVNLELANLKLQMKDAKDNWILTEAGTAYGEMKPFHNKGHSGYEILWKKSVIDLLIEQRNMLLS